MGGVINEPSILHIKVDNARHLLWSLVALGDGPGYLPPTGGACSSGRWCACHVVGLDSDWSVLTPKPLTFLCSVSHPCELLPPEHQLQSGPQQDEKGQVGGVLAPSLVSFPQVCCPQVGFQEVFSWQRRLCGCSAPMRRGRTPPHPRSKGAWSHDGTGMVPKGEWAG